MLLHGYFRSSASWRVRIALGLKKIPHSQLDHRLRDGDQRSAAFLAVNPQGLVPALALDSGEVLSQSLAICEYLDEIVPEPPLLPPDPIGRAQVRMLAQIIACDIHPLQNLKVLKRLGDHGLDEDATRSWARTTIEEGLSAYERHIAGTAGRFSHGDRPTLADICLIPQLGNARRFGAALDFSRILAVEAACRDLEAFAAAAPDAQPDAQ